MILILIQSTPAVLLSVKCLYFLPQLTADGRDGQLGVVARPEFAREIKRFARVRVPVRSPQQTVRIATVTTHNSKIVWVGKN